jgi:hypothetical protein
MFQKQTHISLINIIGKLSFLEKLIFFSSSRIIKNSISLTFVSLNLFNTKVYFMLNLIVLIMHHKY